MVDSLVNPAAYAVGTLYPILPQAGQMITAFTKSQFTEWCNMWLGNIVVGHCTCNQQVLGLTPGCCMSWV